MNYKTEWANLIEMADRRAFLAKNMPVCPKCKTKQVQLVDSSSIAEWKCRHCKYKFEYEPGITP